MSIPPNRRDFLQKSGLALAGTYLTALGGSGLLAGFLTVPAIAAPLPPGKPAPAFSGTDIDGNSVNLADFKGKPVILEWTNHGCPFVRKHYDSANMQRLQAELTAKGAVWLTIISSAPGEQGHVSPQEAKARYKAEKWSATKVILDPKGEIGRTYDAKVTPHMFIIGADGTLLYEGGIDDKPTAKQEDIPGATNYVRGAMDDILTGKPVRIATSRPYGCSVKYSKTTT
jgi:peroxiredoxin